MKLKRFIPLINSGKKESEINSLAVSKKVLEIIENIPNKGRYTGK